MCLSCVKVNQMKNKKNVIILISMLVILTFTVNTNVIAENLESYNITTNENLNVDTNGPYIAYKGTLIQLNGKISGGDVNETELYDFKWTITKQDGTIFKEYKKNLYPIIPFYEKEIYNATLWATDKKGNSAQETTTITVIDDSRQNKGPEVDIWDKKIFLNEKFLQIKFHIIEHESHLFYFEIEWGNGGIVERWPETGFEEFASVQKEGYIDGFYIFSRSLEDMPKGSNTVKITAYDFYGESSSDTSSINLINNKKTTNIGYKLYFILNHLIKISFPYNFLSHYIL